MSIEPMFYGVMDASEATSLGRTKIYELMDSGQLPSVKVGARRLIPREALEQFAARLIAEQVAS
jgi:excisionase family DNA binding protein